VFPDSKHGRFRWISLVEGGGNDFLTNQEDYVYLIGTYEEDINSELNPQYDLFSINSKESYQVISRIKGKDILMNSLNKLEILTTGNNNDNNEWIELYNTKDDKNKPWKLFSNPISELSIHYSKQSSQWIITCLRMSENKIQQCVSSSIYGSYTCSYVANIEAPWDSKELITYAAKAHPEIKIFDTTVADTSITDFLNNSHASILSFVSNAVKGPVMLFKEEFRDTYTPKFISLETFNKEKQ
jgi:hypothetical protein